MRVLTKVISVILKVLPEFSGEKTGLKSGDKIISMNGKILDLWTSISQVICNNQNKLLQLNVERNKQIISLRLTPDSQNEKSNKKIQFLGVKFLVIPLADQYKIVQKYDLFNALQEASAKTWQLIKTNCAYNK